MPLPSAAKAAPRSHGLEGVDFTFGIGEGENDLPRAHAGGRNEVLDPRGGDHDIAARHDLFERCPFGAHQFDARDGFGIAIGPEHLADSISAQQPHDAGACGPQADLADGADSQTASEALGCGHQRRQRHDRRAVLVVVQHRFIQQRPQPFFDLEAFGRREVLQLDGAEGLLDGHDGRDHTGRVTRLQQNGHAADIHQLREQRGLAFHDRQARQCADITQAQHRGAVGDDGHGIVDRGVVMDFVRIGLDGQAHPRDPRGVHIPQYLRGVDVHPRNRADLAAPVPVEHPIRLAHETRGRQLVDALVQGVVGVLVHLEGDFPQRAALLAPQRGQVLEHQPFIGNDLQHLGQAAGLVQHLDDEDFRNFHGAAILRNWRSPRPAATLMA